MRKLLGDYRKFIRMKKEKGLRLISGKCPNCRKTIKTSPAPDGQVWDTLSVCPHCEISNFKVTEGSKVSFIKLPH